jgi:hypothetical protein
MVEIAESAHERDGVSLRVGSMILRHCTRAEQNAAQNRNQSFHLVNPPKSGN